MARTADAFVPAITRLGWPDAGVARKAAAYARCDETLDRIGAKGSGRVSAWSPGRIEVFGKHTDYAGGRSLLVAVDHGFVVRAAPRADARVCVLDAATGNSCDTIINVTASAPDGHWSNYVATVARRVARNFPGARTGVDLAFESDLPPAAGVSSSSALLIGVFSALAAVNRLETHEAWRTSLTTRELLAGYLGATENGGSFGALAGESGVGTLGGSQDQTAILCAEPGQLVDYGWMPVRRIGAYPLPATHCFVVASSGVVAEKSAGAREQYNRASRMVSHLLATWNADTGRDDRSLAAAMESVPDAADHLRALLPSAATTVFTVTALRDRLEQFLLETYTLIPAAADAFAAQDYAALGRLTARSQRAAEEWLGNQIPETVALVRLGLAQGALAASAFGAGFGGSVWALVRTDGADAFCEAWADAYRREFPAAGSHAMFFTTAAGPAAAWWPDAPPAV